MFNQSILKMMVAFLWDRHCQIFIGDKLHFNCLANETFHWINDGTAVQYRSTYFTAVEFNLINNAKAPLDGQRQKVY